MFKNIVALAKAHCFSSLGTCRQSMSSETLMSFNLFADSLLSFLLSANVDKTLSFSSEVEVMSLLAFANL